MSISSPKKDECHEIIMFNRRVIYGIWQDDLKACVAYSSLPWAQFLN